MSLKRRKHNLPIYFPFESLRARLVPVSDDKRNSRHLKALYLPSHDWIRTTPTTQLSRGQQILSRCRFPSKDHDRDAWKLRNPMIYRARKACIPLSLRAVITSLKGCPTAGQGFVSPQCDVFRLHLAKLPRRGLASCGAAGPGATLYLGQIQLKDVVIIEGQKLDGNLHQTVSKSTT